MNDTAPRSWTVACLQVSPGNDLVANLATLDRLIRQAAGQGAGLVALPEFATFLDRDGRAMRASARAEADSEALATLSALAAELGIWLLIGSLVIRPDGAEKLANRCYLIDPQGRIAARYDKIHLFDAQLADGRTVGESRAYVGGQSAVVVDTPRAVLGLSICYDIRFPGLYRDLALAGAEALAIPSAFTAETGRDHWEPLLRARAIETAAFVLAPATCGTHPGDWHTYGHAMILDPWGKILAQMDGETVGFCLATLDLDRVAAIRARLPSLTTNPPRTLTRITQERTLA